MAENGFAEGLAVGMTNGNNGCYMPMYPMGYGGGGGGFGLNSEWGGIIGLLVVASIFGNGGLGVGGNGRGNAATQADLAAGFANSEIMSDLNDILLQNSQGFAGVQQTLCQGFSGVNATVNTVGNTINQGICNLGYTLTHQISDCCCQTQRAIDSVRYENAKNTCDIIRAGQDNTRAILDYLTGEKISSLQAENAGLKAQISNDRQSAYLLNELKPCPIPAYLTCNPNAPYGLGYGVGYGLGAHNGGCCGASVQ